MLRKVLATVTMSLMAVGASVAAAAPVAAAPAPAAQAVSQSAVPQRQTSTPEPGTVYAWQCSEAGGYFRYGSPSPTGLYCMSFTYYYWPIVVDPEYGLCKPGTRFVVRYSIIISAECVPD